MCLACIKLDFEGTVMSRIVHCPIQTQVKQVSKQWTNRMQRQVEDESGEVGWRRMEAGG